MIHSTGKYNCCKKLADGPRANEWARLLAFIGLMNEQSVFEAKQQPYAIPYRTEFTKEMCGI